MYHHTRTNLGLSILLERRHLQAMLLSLARRIHDLSSRCVKWCAKHGLVYALIYLVNDGPVLICLARSANLSVLIDSSGKAGEMVQMIAVCELPPGEGSRILVSLLLRYGI